VVSYTPRHAPLGKNPQCPVYMRLGGLQSQSGRDGEEKIPSPSGSQTPVVQPVV